MQRVLEPEWLDALPPDDTRAQRSRADLRRVNRLMGNARHVARALGEATRVADLGAGDGSFMHSVAKRLARPGVEVVLVDRAAAMDAERFAPLQWKAASVVEDVYAFLSRPGPRFDAMVANLFLHHFETERLRRLLELIARRTQLFVACEPRRCGLALRASGLLGLIGCNDVTRHDALVSVRAGFRDHELSALWPRHDGWLLAEGAARPFGHIFVARHDAAL